MGQYTLFLIRKMFFLDQKIIDVKNARPRENDTDEFVLFFDRGISDQKIRMLVGEYPRVKIVTLPRRTIPFVSAHVSAARAIAREKLDLLHVPDGHTPYFYNGRTVITIHDLAILRHPEWFPESALERFVSTRILLRRAIDRAKCIIVPSEATAVDVRNYYGVSQDRVRVIPLASALPPGSRPPTQMPSGRYLLFVGTIEPRKNLVRLLSAFKKIDDHEVRLVIAGKQGWKNREIMEAIKKTERVEYRGYVSEEEKRWLMKHALAFVFPSLYEGFGLPVLEAMSVGTPVITSNTSSLPEVAGNAALLIDPEDEDGLRDAINRIILDSMLRAELACRGRALATTFSWSKTAEHTLAVYPKLFKLDGDQ